jgi:hypothetical protein
MAKVSLNELNSSPTNNQGGDKEYPVQFFKLNNGEDAIVRLLIDSPDDFDVRTVHNVKMDGWQYGRNVNCIMENGDTRTCPLCAKGEKLLQKLYIKLLRYTTTPDGKVVVTPMIWERNRYDRTFGTQPLANHITSYGPLSDIIVRISRSGEGLDTVYTPTFGLNIMPNSKAIYRDDIYVKDTSLFGDFDVLGVSILDKNYSELSHFAQTGTFPQREFNNQNAQAPGTVATNYNTTHAEYGVANNSTPSANTVSAPQYETVQPRTAPANANNMPWSNNGDGQFSRPRRY